MAAAGLLVGCGSIRAGPPDPVDHLSDADRALARASREKALETSPSGTAVGGTGSEPGTGGTAGRWQLAVAGSGRAHQDAANQIPGIDAPRRALVVARRRAQSAPVDLGPRPDLAVVRNVRRQEAISRYFPGRARLTGPFASMARSSSAGKTPSKRPASTPNSLPIPRAFRPPVTHTIASAPSSPTIPSPHVVRSNGLDPS
jgi:hypothetical protein